MFAGARRQQAPAPDGGGGGAQRLVRFGLLGLLKLGKLAITHTALLHK